MDDDSEDVWERIRKLAEEVADEFRDIGVSRIEAAPYEDSLGHPAVRFTVWLTDKPDDSDYAWRELSPIEKRFSERLQEMGTDRFPYTTYVLESEAAERAAAMG